MATDRQQADDNARYQIEIGLAYAEPRRADYRTEGFYSRALREWKTLEAFYDRTGLARPNVLTVIFPEPELVREYQPAQLGRQHTKSDLERSIAMSSVNAGLKMHQLAGAKMHHLCDFEQGVSGCPGSP
jgi:hypothetical protein